VSVINKDDSKLLIEAAMGERTFDLVIKNTELVNVYTGEIVKSVIGIVSGYIAYVGFKDEELEAKEYIDAKGKYAVPGLIDAHMHIESTMATPSAFAEGILPHGTTTIIADPHEIANVFGAEGVEMMLDASEGLPVKTYMMIPSTVPSYEGMETSGASICAEDIKRLIDHERVLGLGEVMDFWGVVNRDDKITKIVNEVRNRGGIIEGHTPIFEGKELQAFIAAGVDSDHTIMDRKKIEEKLRSGMCVQIQERFITPDLMEYINDLDNFSNVLIVTDDVTADRLSKTGHLDGLVRKAISCGLDPIKAITAVTINAARRMRLHNLGGIGPGRIADILLLDSLEKFEIDTVITDGKIAVKNDKVLIEVGKSSFPKSAYNSIKMNELDLEDFEIKTKSNSGIANVNVIVVNGEGSYTVKETSDVKIDEGVLDISSEDMYYMAVFERHGVKGSRNIGLIKGIGDFKGAIATTYAHDCHNLVVIGKDPNDMKIAANKLIASGGGMCAVSSGEILSWVELPIAGILSDKSINEISAEINNLVDTIKELGIRHREPIMIMTILALAVSPEIKVSDLGIVDVLNKKIIDLINYEEEGIDE
jgi:adenine deaminase